MHHNFDQGYKMDQAQIFSILRGFPNPKKPPDSYEIVLFKISCGIIKAFDSETCLTTLHKMFHQADQGDQKVLAQLQSFWSSLRAEGQPWLQGENFALARDMVEFLYYATVQPCVNASLFHHCKFLLPNLANAGIVHAKD